MGCIGCMGCGMGADGTGVAGSAEGVGATGSAEGVGATGSAGTKGTNALGSELRTWRCGPRDAAPRNPDGAGTGAAGMGA